MYIQDSTLSSAFYEAEKEYIEQVKNVILIRYKELQELGYSENEALERTKEVEGERYKRFLKKICMGLSKPIYFMLCELPCQETEKGGTQRVRDYCRLANV